MYSTSDSKKDDYTFGTMQFSNALVWGDIQDTVTLSAAAGWKALDPEKPDQLYMDQETEFWGKVYQNAQGQKLMIAGDAKVVPEASAPANNKPDPNNPPEKNQPPQAQAALTIDQVSRDE